MLDVNMLISKKYAMTVLRCRQMAFLTCLFTAFAAAGPIRTGEPALPKPKSGRPAIFVDRSHEWLFAYDDLADRMLSPNGFDVVLCDASLGALAPLNAYAVVMVQQAGTHSVVSSHEVDLLRNYVAAGGQLLLVVKPDLPLVKVAKGFGFALQNTQGKKPLKANGPLIRYGSPKAIPTRRIPYTLKRNKGMVVLVTDTVGRPVAGVRRFVKGRVLLWPDDHSYWDFCSQRGADMRVPSAPTTLALFRYLTGDPPRPNKGRVRRLEGEIVEKHGPLVLRYSMPNEEATRLLRLKMPGIIRELEKWNGRGLPASPEFTVNFLSGGGGGWAGGNAIGVGTIGDPAYLVKVMAHEMTHTITGPWPWIFNEGWASTVGMRVAASLGYPESARDEHKRWRALLDKADPKHSKLDIMDSEDPKTKQRAHEAKAMWMIEELEVKNGHDFIARFLDARERHFSTRQSIGLTETLELFSEVAGEDLTAWYKSIGTRIKVE